MLSIADWPLALLLGRLGLVTVFGGLGVLGCRGSGVLGFRGLQFGVLRGFSGFRGLGF